LGVREKHPNSHPPILLAAPNHTTGSGIRSSFTSETAGSTRRCVLPKGATRWQRLFPQPQERPFCPRTYRPPCSRTHNPISPKPPNASSPDSPPAPAAAPRSRPSTRNLLLRMPPTPAHSFSLSPPLPFPLSPFLPFSL